MVQGMKVMATSFVSSIVSAHNDAQYNFLNNCWSSWFGAFPEAFWCMILKHGPNWSTVTSKALQ